MGKEEMKNGNKKRCVCRSRSGLFEIDPFKQTMIEWGRKTLTFPNARGVFINEEVTHAHGSVFYFKKRIPHLWCKVQEGWVILTGLLNEWINMAGVAIAGHIII